MWLTTCASPFIPIAQVVPRMMKVLSRSNTESTSEAVSEMEAE
jgi:hypothetical protein